MTSELSAPKTGDPVAMDIMTSRVVQEVQGMIVVAKRFPRDVAAARARLLAECEEPELAEDAEYEFPRGGTMVSGPSIRLAEAGARAYGNMVCGVVEVARRRGESDALAYAWDLETNFRDDKLFTVKHWRDTKGGGYAISDERDIYEAVANQGARRKRACILTIIPPPLMNAAVRACDATLKRAAGGKSLAERVDAMLEAFAEYGVTPAAIEARLGASLDSVTEAGMARLRRAYSSIRDGMAKASELFPEPQGAPSVSAPGAAPPPAAGLSGMADAMDAGQAPAVSPQAAPEEPRKTRKSRAKKDPAPDATAAPAAPESAPTPAAAEPAKQETLGWGDPKAEPAKSPAAPAPAATTAPQGIDTTKAPPASMTISELEAEANRLFDLKDEKKATMDDERRLTPVLDMAFVKRQRQEKR